LQLLETDVPGDAGLSEFSHRVKNSWSSLDVRDRSTQLTLAGTAAAIVLVVGLIAWSTGGAGSSGSRAAGSVSERATKIASDLEKGGVESSGPLSGTAAKGAGGGNLSSGGASRAAASLPPVTATTIKVGISYLEDAGSAEAAAGFSNVGQIDERRGWDAMIKEINRNPPYGRKVVPVYFSFTTDEVESKGGERLEQEACAHFTQDNKVFMVWDGRVGGDILSKCLTKAGVAEIGGGGGSSWSQTYRDYPYLVSPTGVAMDRLASFEIDRLYAAGYFSKFKDNDAPYTPQKPLDGKPRIGLIRYDQPSYKAGAAAMKKRLAAHGLSLCDGCEFEVAYSSDNVAEILDDSAEVNAAIQNFKSKGVTHVLFLGTTAGVRITLFFVDGAEKQQYRPRLGLNPNDAPTAVRDFLGPASYPQFRQSVLVADGPVEFDVRTDAFKECKAIFERAGESFEGDQGANKEDQIPAYCDTAWYFGSAIRSAGRSLSLSAWMNAVHRMQPVPSASVYLMQTKAGRHDGSGAIRVGAWFDDCNCFKPTTGVISI
jgi:hypothetical protein